MNAIADEINIAVAYSQGLPDFGGKSHWNAGLTGTNLGDVSFLSALAQTVQKQYKLSSEKTFACVYSIVGFMSKELVAEIPEVLTAAECFDGTMSGKTWKGRNKIAQVPILQLSGALDDVKPIDGSLTAAGEWGGLPDIKTVTHLWSELSACAT